MMIALIITSLVLYAIPFRYLIIGWGIYKFTKKLLWRPKRFDKFEILAFLSRVPNDEQLVNIFKNDL
jgi:hypothetical protein